ncbi:MFS transporter [Salipaludibacillus neizhouensis]|uniref:MFS transporter n=1 Tax=Salipaludibacillus neizhouensis TaxID=885475 RepID=A0A3A9KCB0_9BACI|nr:MFS transporter [Salipaludibacillus neizhouensis]RKL68172.1 MFS transporter [Salipaludibacillus neizhouensis]
MSWFSLQKEKRLSSLAVTTLMNHTIFHFGNSLSLIFLNLYLWRLTNDLWINGLFNLIAILTQAMMTLSIGKVAKQKDRLTIYRYGILLTALFYFAILLTQEHIVEFFYLFAILRGIAQSLYWLGYFTLMFEVSNDLNRHRYLGWNQITMGSANLIGPAASGAIISQFEGLSGYLIVFAMAFVMFTIATFGSFRMKRMTTHHREYYMKYLPLIMKRAPGFKRALIGWFIIGFPQGILMYVPPILLYTILLEESTVGYLNVLFLFISILASYVISRIADVSKTRSYLTVAAIGFIVSVLVLFIDITIWTFIVFMAVSAIFKPIQANAYAAHYFQWLGVIPLKDHFRVESVVLRETITNAGRGFGIIVFMVFAQELNTDTIPWVLAAVLGMQLFVPRLIEETPTLISRRNEQ